jgi:hypothetical protein
MLSNVFKIWSTTASGATMTEAQGGLTNKMQLGTTYLLPSLTVNDGQLDQIYQVTQRS